MHKSSSNMKRIQIMSHFLLACLLLAASQNLIFMSIMVQAIESGDIKHRTMRLGVRTIVSGDSGSWEKTKQEDQGKKDGKDYWKGNLRKVPSGPNPIGNLHPPSHH